MEEPHGDETVPDALSTHTPFTGIKVLKKNQNIYEKDTLKGLLQHMKVKAPTKISTLSSAATPLKTRQTVHTKEAFSLSLTTHCMQADKSILDPCQERNLKAASLGKSKIIRVNIQCCLCYLSCLIGCFAVGWPINTLSTGHWRCRAPQGAGSSVSIQCMAGAAKTDLQKSSYFLLVQSYEEIHPRGHSSIVIMICIC